MGKHSRKKRFSIDERRILGSTAVRWRNGTWWHDAVITGGIKDDDGTEYVEAFHAGPGTRTISPGAVIRIYPGSLRARLGPAQGAPR